MASETSETSEAVTGELIPPYDPIESARLAALHNAAEIVKSCDIPFQSTDLCTDAVLKAADRLFEWLRRDA